MHEILKNNIEYSQIFHITDDMINVKNHFTNMF